MKNLKFSPKGPTTFKIFRFETLFIADYENLPKFVFDWLQNYGSKTALFCGMITLLNE